MACPGVKLGLERSLIVDTIKLYRGRLLPAAKALKIDRKSLRKYIENDKDLSEMLAELRCDYDENLKDKAEDCLERAMDQTSDIGNSLKSAFFVLNNKGEDRGYRPPQVTQYGDMKITPEQLRQVKEMISKDG